MLQITPQIQHCREQINVWSFFDLTVVECHRSLEHSNSLHIP